MMKFHPPPENDFQCFCETYFERCRQRVPQIRVVAAKWRFEDLIPGLSDFDTRFVLADGMKTADWNAMSLAVGAVHAELAREHPDWARNLEHLPGLNLMVSEVTDPAQYYPEFNQWTFYTGDAAIIAELDAALPEDAWNQTHESYHLHRVGDFFGPYLRGIDPAVNLGPWENKYPLHSRFLHYFTPPVQAMVSLLLRRTIPGKLEALRLARSHLPNPEVIELIFDTLECHYETPELLRDPALAELEGRLERYLGEAWAAVADSVTLIEPGPDETRDSLRAKLAALPVNPIETFFARAKFSRLMQGRLLFYAERIRGFDSAWLIRNELGRIVENFFHRPLGAFGLARFGVELEADVVLDRLTGRELTKSDVRGMRRFAEIASRPIAEGREREQARAVAETYEPVLTVLETLRTDLLKDTSQTRSPQPALSA